MGLFSTFGLTFSATGYAGVIKGLALFPLLLPAAHFAAYTFVTSPVSDSVLDALPVPVAKVPALVAFLLVALAAGSGLVAIVAINLLGGHYDNHTPRVLKGPALSEELPAVYRLQCAHNNSIECLAYVTPAFWMASAHELPPPLCAKLSLFLLAARVAYIAARDTAEIQPTTEMQPRYGPHAAALNEGACPAAPASPPVRHAPPPSDTNDAPPARQPDAPAVPAAVGPGV
ncbi:hypothetical protein EMIHUDRAFT_432224 [Emiliania huxleyi CCMP1516]|uniref:Amino acid transporter transmembrane domain-containing protein n=2 Tax=Emiliania huxleyi TaxID=2903 RepID=A0A0D3J353_EMIH1|nr:hypothetical protein EMIHUDRAFT_432224 [Emiliania huxleyi CCMP1516]EOD17938.1 hypothetical protein EMIHUDRAFT_432224 [Emiliania huxleyi CCMP1516]|eukprot:XP_005770367.1 hypothetical protein EMIHUDRAFT_432224 [Emiliania huxleyi CCMP1516]